MKYYFFILILILDFTRAFSKLDETYFDNFNKSFCLTNKVSTPFNFTNNIILTNQVDSNYMPYSRIHFFSNSSFIFEHIIDSVDKDTVKYLYKTGNWYYSNFYNILSISFNDSIYYHYIPKIEMNDFGQKKSQLLLININKAENLYGTYKTKTRKLKLNWFWDILLGIIGGILAAIVYQKIINIIQSRKYKKLYYHNLNDKSFECYWKHDKKKDKLWDLNFTVENNVVKITGEKCKDQCKDQCKIQGEFTFDEKMPFYARGYYKDIDGVGFAFFDIQTNKKMKEFYVNAPYIKAGKTKKSREIIPQAFIWKLLEK